MLGALCALAGGARANEVASTENAAVPESSTPAPSTPAMTAPPERHWRLGIAAGYGRRTNPLIQSEDIPVAVDVDIAWFGRRWFFDNGDLGVTLIDRDRFTTSLVARVNSDRAFFSKTNTKYVTFLQSAGGAQPPALDFTGTPIPAPEPLKPPRRDYAIEAGFETLIDGAWGAATLRAFHDVSNTHDGYEISASYDYRITRGRLSIAPSLGIAYKDDALSDYYWGVHEDEASFVLQQYFARGGLSWEVGLRGSYYLSEHLRIAASANYERLEYSVARSPLVKDPYVVGYFAGLAWTF